jgi:hypothetical protein
MPARKLTVATILALVALAAPAHAAYVETIDLDNVVFSGGDIVNGDVYINTNLPFAVNTDQNLISIDGLYFFVRTGLTLNSVSGLYYNGPATQNPQSLLETLTVNLADLLNLSISDFTLTNYGQSSPPTYAVSGEVSCASRCSVSATPLPAALPLFGSTLFALVNFAARQSRRTGCG